MSQAVIFYGVEETAPQYLQLCDDAQIAHRSIIKKQGFGLSARRQLRKALKEYEPSVVIAHHHDTAITAALTMPGCRSHSVVFVEHHSNALKTSKDWLLSTVAHRCSDHTVYLTPSYREAVQNKLGRWFNVDKTSVIANGLDLCLYSKATRGDINAGDFVIGMQGRMDAGKDYDTLLHAFALVPEVIGESSIKLDLAGDGPDRSRLEALSKDLGVSDRVTFLGFLKHEELIERMRTWQISTLCTRGETLSIALLESWALELPLISMNVPGVMDLMNDGEDGCLVKPSCPRSLASSIEVLMNNESLRHQLGAAGRNRLEQEFDRSRNWGEYEQMIRSLRPRNSTNSNYIPTT